MLIDEVKIRIIGGKGGDGRASFDSSKLSKGPTGGKGGNGGRIFLEGISNLSALNKFRYKKVFAAPDGENGKTRRLDGANGEDLILKVPIGTVAHNLDTGKDYEILQVGQKELIAKGGKGGRGNYYFRSSTNTTPREFEYGTAGESFNFFLELRLIAEVGLVGLPNAGKSSLLNALTKAEARVASYPFTTLEPNLGAYYDLIIADIPGLIEGASQGKGLGTKFLRHIKRTKILIHCISSESQDPAKDYQTIRQELEKYEPELAKKKEHLFLTKIDLLTEKEVKEKLKEMKKLNKNAMAVSVYDYESIEKVKKLLSEIKSKIH